MLPSYLHPKRPDQPETNEGDASRPDVADAVDITDVTEVASLMGSGSLERLESTVESSDAPSIMISPVVVETRPSNVPIDFEELTLAQAFGLLVRRPGSTLVALVAVARAPRDESLELPDLSAPPRVQAPFAYSSARSSTLEYAAVPAETGIADTMRSPLDTASVGMDSPAPGVVLASDVLSGVRLGRLILRLIGLVIALVGSARMIGAPVRGEFDFIQNGLYLFVVAAIVWLVGEALPFVSRVVRGVPRNVNNVRVAPYRCDDRALVPLTLGRGFAALVTIVAVVQAYVGSQGNQFTALGVFAWAIALFAAVWTVAPEGWSPLTLVGNIVGAIRGARPRWTLPGLVLIAIVIGGAALRLADVDGLPPEMTSDHVEKLLDVDDIVRNGRANVFFANNGGRDSLHFYFLATLSLLPGVELNFTLLKLATAIEGTLTIVAVYWMGRELIGKGDRALAEIVGLLLAALIAVSAWHLFLSRIGLRMVLTPLVVAMVLGFLARGLRYNRRWDFIYAGIAIGVGLYSYQALRMLPIVVVVGAVLALAIGAGTWRVRLTLLGNMAALIVIAAVIFIPLYRYSIDYPDDFWNRSSGRLFGDDLTQETDENGNLRRRTPTLQERLDAFGANVPNLLVNTRNALLMFHWRGDVAWFHNSPNQPVLDFATGGLLVVGAAAWLARAARRGDPVDWLIVPAILIMMLPSILSLAFPVENPSHTRISGALPGVYFLMALALAVIVLELRRLGGRVGGTIAVVGCAAVIGVSVAGSGDHYFTGYRASYAQNALPYSEAGAILRRFAVADRNGYGNGFILAYPYWWDHRALGISGGALRWNNTILNTDEIAKVLRDGVMRAANDPFRLDPNAALLFFLSIDDESGRAWLIENLPAGLALDVTSYNQRPYVVFEAPAIGIQGLNEVFSRAGLEAATGS